MSQKYSAEEIESRMSKVLEGFRKLLAENELPGFDVFHIELRETADLNTLFASKTDCTWKRICRPTPHGWVCRYECV